MTLLPRDFTKFRRSSNNAFVCSSKPDKWLSNEMTVCLIGIKSESTHNLSCSVSYYYNYPYPQFVTSNAIMAGKLLFRLSIIK